MDLADFFAIDRLSEHDEETLVESAMQLQQVMMLYESGIREIKTKLDILADESRISGKPSPINAIKSRIKTPRSIVGKLGYAHAAERSDAHREKGLYQQSQAERLPQPASDP